MSQCAVSLVLLELLASHSSLSTMLIRASLKAVRHSPPLCFPFHLATVQLLWWSHLYSPRTPLSLSFSYHGFEKYLCMQVPNGGTSGSQFLASTSLHLVWRFHVQLLEGTEKEPGNILISHPGKKVAQCRSGAPHMTLADVSDTKIENSHHCSCSYTGAWTWQDRIKMLCLAGMSWKQKDQNL